MTRKAGHHVYAFVLTCVLNKSLTVCLSDRLIVLLAGWLAVYRILQSLFADFRF